MIANSLAHVEEQLRQQGLIVPDDAYLVDYDLTTGAETWRSGWEFVVVGTPGEGHDCDEMNCSSFSHTIDRWDARS